MKNTLEYALRMDAEDPLRSFRDEFHQPGSPEKPQIYFCGNSLGLQPKSVKEDLLKELEDWKYYGIDGFHKPRAPWMTYPQQCADPLGKILGAAPGEIAIMNALTANLHFLLCSLYRPDGKRNKILMEAGAFPSDQYAVETQLKFHGIDPAEGMIEIGPRAGENLVRLEDIADAIHRNRDTISVVLTGGVNYYTGQLFDMRAITVEAHRAGALAGFDLAHAVGNLPLCLHDWDVDFAVWCSYKYLNGGPGAVGGAFLHDRISADRARMRLAGWWGNDEGTRFDMKKQFEAQAGAGGWQTSTPPVFNMVALRSSLKIFSRTSMQMIRDKSIRLTGYLEFLLREMGTAAPEIITGPDPMSRGAQLSLRFGEPAADLHRSLAEAGVVSDFRKPGVIRMAPAPLYNSFEEVFDCVSILRSLVGV
ncbi:MAG TPA: kynureninase [Chitinophagaceae bacterium]|nr:kynureninase [Chitinophagaceae bacterium]